MNQWAYRDLYTRDGPHPHRVSLNSYAESIQTSSSPADRQDGANDEEHDAEPAAPTTVAPTPRSPSQASTPGCYSVLQPPLLTSLAHHPHSGGVRSWIHELPNDAVGSSSSSSNNNNSGLPRRASTASSDSMPTSSRASPRPLAPSIPEVAFPLMPPATAGGMRPPVPMAPPPLPRYVPEAGRGGAAREAAAAPSAARFVAIGIDFGTTYSGVSWAFSGDPGDIKDVQQYPCVGSAIKGRDEVQVPTQYDQRTGAWGYLVDKGHAPIKWFKLLLLRDADIAEDIRGSAYLQQARQQAALLGDDGVIDLVADFLRNLWQHALREVELQIDAAALQNLPFRVALTVPAIWPQYARTMMHEAVRRAGLLARRDIADTTVVLVEEPEAAALATLLDRRAYPEMAVGETFVVVDCGGGTIDIISYRVVDTRPFVIREAVRGAGKLCGAFLVDDAFEDHMRRRAGLRLDKCEPADVRKFVSDEWEYALKRSFTGSEVQHDFYLRPPPKALPLMARVRGSSECVLNKSTVVGFFDETYQGIRRLISAQCQEIVRQEGKPPKKILLVGGLGSSRYLYRKLQTDYDNVIQPQRAWSAVARGAVIKLLKNAFAQKDVVAAADARQRALLLAMPDVDARIARDSYGVETGVPVDRAFPPVDPAADRITTEPDGQQRVWRMQWYLCQGDALDNRAPVSHKFYEYVRSPARTQTTFVVYTSDALPPPSRRDSSCRLLCTIHCDYDTPFHALPVVDEARGVRLVDGMRLTMRFNGEPEWRLQVGTKTIEQKVDVQFA